MSRNVMIEEIMCNHPVPKFPYYHVKVKIRNNTNKSYYINKLIGNRKGTRDFLIFCGDDFVFEPVIKANSSSFIIARVDWQNNDEVRVEMELIREDREEKLEISKDVRTPNYGGYHDTNWKYYFSIVLTERFGINRINEPIHISATVYSDRVKDPTREIRVVEVDSITGEQREIPSQVFDVSKPYTKIKDETIQPSVTFDLAFFANVNKKESKVYLVFYGNERAEKPQYDSELMIAGNGIGLGVENKYYRMNLHKKSGSIDEIIPKMGVNKKLEHHIETNGAVHWNPGIYSPPTAWTHTSDWEKESLEHYYEERGPVCLITQRYGSLPLYPGAKVSQTYIFYSKCPFIRVFSTIDIMEGIYVQALRNGEIVFNHNFMKEFALRDKLGEIKDFVITQLPRFEEIALTFEADTPWTAFYNSEYKFGFAEMTINIANTRRKGGLVRLEHHYQYINWGPWVYVTRNLVFPFGSQNPQRMTFLPESCSYYEDMIFMPFVFKESSDKYEKFSYVEEVYSRFKNPLYLQVEYDTDYRVPAKFVLGARLPGEIEETEEKPWPITLSQEYTRFRQSPTLLNELHFKERNNKYYYR